jgi:hypothetical protein
LLRLNRTLAINDACNLGDLYAEIAVLFTPLREGDKMSQQVGQAGLFDGLADCAAAESSSKIDSSILQSLSRRLLVCCVMIVLTMVCLSVILVEFVRQNAAGVPEGDDAEAKADVLHS